MEKYLQKCIQSIVSQSYQNLEIILIDDGSRDQSGNICDEYAKIDSRIQVIHRENCGVSSARNTGLMRAKGDYITFVDSDDYIKSDMYEILVRAVEEYNVDIATCRYFFDYNGIVKEVKNNKLLSEHPMRTAEFLHYVYERDTYKGVSNYIWTKLYKRELIVSENGNLDVQFEAEYSLGEDNIFNAEVYCRSSSIMFVDLPLYYYVQHENSVMRDIKKQFDSLSIVKGYERVIEIFECNNINEEIVDYVKRFYVYWCGKYLDYAIQTNNSEKGIELQNRIKPYFSIYAKTNLDNLERVQWICNILLHKF